MLSVLAACAAMLGGCVAISSISSNQQDIVGKLRLTLTICKVDQASVGGQNHPGCDIQTNGGEASTNSIDAQVLVAYRVPTDSGAPQTLSGVTNDATASSLAFSRSPDYEAELTRLVPPGAGQKWVGYLSALYDYDGGAAGTPARQVTVSVDLDLPRPADGGPFVGPLPLRPVVGARDVTVARPAGRTVACGSSAYSPSAGNTICIDSPLEAQVGTNFSFPTRDFGIVAGKATVSPGQSVTLPFGVRGAGTLPVGLTATLTAGTTLPGAAVAPSAASAPLSNGSDTRVTVPVTVPETAGPGTFDVTLAGRLDNGELRTGVAKLTVRDRQKPVLSKAKAKPKTFRAATKKRPKRGTRVSFALSEVASVRATAQRCVKRAGKRKRGRCLGFKTVRGAIVQTDRQPGANAFRFNGRLRGKALKPGLYRLVLTPTDAAGNVGEPARAAFAVRK
jgi:hypothetical protein